MVYVWSTTRSASPVLIATWGKKVVRYIKYAVTGIEVVCEDAKKFSQHHRAQKHFPPEPLSKLLCAYAQYVGASENALQVLGRHTKISAATQKKALEALQQEPKKKVRKHAPKKE